MNDFHENDDDDLRAEARRERAEQSRAWHWCSDCHGHTGPGSPCYDGPEPEEETMTLAEMFAQCEDDYLDFDKWTDAPSKRADLAAFILLDKLQPGGGDIVCASEHDEFRLSIDCDELAKVITQADVRNLTRCGVRYSGDYDCLSMFA
jgi:hypothetical protein